jgi:hypothetical protein
MQKTRKNSRKKCKDSLDGIPALHRWPLGGPHSPEIAGKGAIQEP